MMDFTGGVQTKNMHLQRIPGGVSVEKIEFPENTIAVSCGFGHTITLSSDGVVHGVGR